MSPHEHIEHVHLAQERAPSEDVPDQAHDPVRGMSVDPATARYQVDLGGSATYFCSEHCRTKFLGDPERYLRPVKPAAPETPASPSFAAAGVVYTCPMHPQIRRSAPGSCPICGMALEPLVATAEGDTSPELRDMTRRFWVGAVLAVPMLILEMGAHIAGMSLHRHVSPLASMWIQFAPGTPVVLRAGWPLLERGWSSLRQRSLNMFTLIGLGVGAAYLYGLAASFAPGLFPASLKHEGGLIPVYYEPAAVITVLVLLGQVQVLELRARERTGSGDRVKNLWWSGDGLCLFAKRLERGKFVWPQATSGTVSHRGNSATIDHLHLPCTYEKSQ